MIFCLKCNGSLCESAAFSDLIFSKKKQNKKKQHKLVFVDLLLLIKLVLRTQLTREITNYFIDG